MARNENPELPNRNTFVTGISGTGKSNILYQLLRKEKIKRRIGWDVDNDHDFKHRVYNIVDFVDYLQMNGHKAAFSVAYSGKASPEVFELFCAAVYEVLDGKMLTLVVGEELADVTNSGKAKQNLGTLIRRGRKYGCVFYGVSQKPQEVSSTVYDNCNYFYVGRLKRLGAKRVFDETDLQPDGLRQLKPLQFCYLTPEFTGQESIEDVAIQFKYVKPKHKKTPTLTL